MDVTKEDNLEQALEELLQAKATLESPYIHIMKALGESYQQLPYKSKTKTNPETNTDLNTSNEFNPSPPNPSGISRQHIVFYESFPEPTVIGENGEKSSLRFGLA